MIVSHTTGVRSRLTGANSASVSSVFRGVRRSRASRTMNTRTNRNTARDSRTGDRAGQHEGVDRRQNRPEHRRAGDHDDEHPHGDHGPCNRTRPSSSGGVGSDHGDGSAAYTPGRNCPVPGRPGVSGRRPPGGRPLLGRQHHRRSEPRRPRIEVVIAARVASVVVGAQRARARPRLRGRRPRRRRRHLRRAGPARAPGAGRRRAGRGRPRPARLVVGSTGCDQLGAVGRPLPPPPEEAPAPRPSPFQATRRGRHLAPLRRVERVLPAGAGPDDDLLVRVLHRRGHRPRRRPAHQVRRDLPQARLARGDASARRRLRLGRHGAARGRSTTACAAVGVTLSARQAAAGRRAGRPPPAWPTASRSASRTTATSTTARSTRSAASACSSTWAGIAWPSTSRLSARPAAAAGPAPQPRHLAARRRRHPEVRHATASSSATCSPTASCTRSAPSSASCRRAASRCATSSRSASTTPARCELGRQPRGQLGPGGRPGGHVRARVWRLYMAASAVNFEAGRTAIHQVLGVRTAVDGGSGMPLSRAALLSDRVRST